MKNVFFLLLTLIMITFTSCEVIGDIFSAGFYTGLFVVLAVIVLLIWLIGKRR
jgi:hypothetical protein